MNLDRKLDLDRDRCDKIIDTLLRLLSYACVSTSYSTAEEKIK